MEIINRIVKWNEERLLDKQEFNLKIESTHILEELIEAQSKFIDSDKARKLANQLYGFLQIHDEKDEKDIVDAFADIIVYATGSILKLGYEPTKVMDEVLKEIESRTGKIVNGKFVKDNKKTMYKADFTKCKRSKNEEDK